MSNQKYIWKNIEDVTNQDTLVGYVDGKFIPTKIQNTTTCVNDRTIKVSFNDGTILHMTCDHPLLTTRGYRVFDYDLFKQTHSETDYANETVGEFLVGDTVIGYGENKIITSVEEQGAERVYTIHNSSTNNYVVDGLVVHNKFCFIAGTQITLSDGTTTPIEELTDSETLKGYNVETSRYKNATFSEVRVIENAQTIRIIFDDGSFIQTTQDHPFLTSTGEYKVADLDYYTDTWVPEGVDPLSGIVSGELVTGDEIKGPDGNKTISSISMSDVRTIYDIIGSTTNNYIADGLISYSF